MYLKTADIHHNSFSILDLDNNHLSNYPPEILSMFNLNELHMAHNYLTYIPKDIGTLTSLSIFDVRWNYNDCNVLNGMFESNVDIACSALCLFNITL